MTTPDAYRDAEYITDVSGIYEIADDEHRDPLTRHGERIKKTQSATKVALIDRLLRDLDILIYCELSALYYMDCSVVLFAVRAIVQLIFFTPKASPFDPTRNQPFVGTIFASNLFCMISHIFFTQLEAGEETRGYLHGGLFIDFIGQKAPIPLLRLLAFDVLIMFLDFIMLGLIIERVKTNEAVASISTPTSAPPETPTPAQAPQDHDSEERGILREASQSIHGDEGVELQDLGTQATNPRTSLDEQLERTGLLIDDSAEARSAKGGHFLDTFAAGEAVIMETSLIDIIRDQWRYSATTATTTRRPVPYNETAAFLRERFGLQVRPDGRLERIEQ